MTFQILMHAAFVADEIWGFMLEPARSAYFSVDRSQFIHTLSDQIPFLWFRYFGANISLIAMVCAMFAGWDLYDKALEHMSAG